MSKLDELLNDHAAADEDEYVVRGYAEVDELRAELAALRRRAEDAEMMLRAAIKCGTAVDTYGVLFMDNHPAFDCRFPIDPATGLPILTDEARKALGDV